MKRLDIRCCCEPAKLLGSVPVPDSASAGQAVKFVVMRPRVRTADASSLRFTAAPREIVLKVEAFTAFGDAHPKFGVAVMADGVDVETLRRIPGFIEEKA